VNTIIERCDCLTPFGAAKDTYRALLEGRRTLSLSPSLGPAGGDEVPLSLASPMTPAIPPRWLKHVLSFKDALSGEHWGLADTPVFLTSSNFGMESMQAFWENKDLKNLD
jgi:hypothetical protein